MRPSRRSPSLADALALFRSAHITECLAALERARGWEAAHLRARAYLRAGDAAAALAEVAVIRDECDAECIAECLTLRAVALGRMGRGDDAADTIEDAFVAAISAAVPEFEAEVLFYRALLHFTGGDIEAAAADAEAVAGVAPLAAPGRRHPMSLRLSNGRALQVLGLAHAARGRTLQGLECGLRAATLLRAGGDRWLDAFALTDVARSAADLEGDIDPKIAAAVASRALVFPWTADLARKEFQIFEALGTTAALRGDETGAFASLRRAAEAASALEDRLSATANAASLAWEIDRRDEARAAFAACLGLIERIEWRRADRERRLTLLTFAQAAAPIDRSRARSALACYRALEDALPLAENERAAALEHVAAAAVERAVNVAAAIGHYLEAHALFSAAGLRRRAAACALELAELGVDRFRDEVARAARAWRDSWFARRARALYEVR